MNPPPGEAANEDEAVQNGIFTVRRYLDGRKATVAFWRDRSESDWSRKCFREGQGELTLFELATLVLGHDGYHVRHTIDSSAATVPR